MFTNYDYASYYKGLCNYSYNKNPLPFFDLSITTQFNSYLFSFVNNKIISGKKLKGELLHIDKDYYLCKAKKDKYLIYYCNGNRLDLLDNIFLSEQIVSQLLKKKIDFTTYNSSNMEVYNPIMSFTGTFDAEAQQHIFEIMLNDQGAFIYNSLYNYDEVSLLKFKRYYFNSYLQQTYNENLIMFFSNKDYSLINSLNLNNFLYNDILFKSVQEGQDLRNIFETYLSNYTEQEKEVFYLKLKLLFIYVLKYYYKIFPTKDNNGAYFYLKENFFSSNFQPLDLFTIQQILKIEDLKIIKAVLTYLNIFIFNVFKITNNSISFPFHINQVLVELNCEKPQHCYQSNVYNLSKEYPQEYVNQNYLLVEHIEEKNISFNQDIENVRPAIKYLKINSAVFNKLNDTYSVNNNININN
jgi:hypothetical protein